MRGFASVGLVRPKHEVNIGSAIRAAHCYGAAMLVIENARAEVKQKTDTQAGWRHMPILRGDDLHTLIPYGAVPVAVDLVDGAENLFTFQHPRSAFYIFGPEDGTLGRRHTEWCRHKIFVPTTGCMNLAATVNVVLYDRALKADRQARGLSWREAS